ncbi:cytochrome P450 [Dichomitus squalens]|uniref:Cytochrome P450 n=1 Tax=Dichomitus squalens TaxID=114155 RepID=A0A4Q9MTV2_9APHY|nr:cytochrome P450 [Dichomitus squalens]
MAPSLPTPTIVEVFRVRRTFSRPPGIAVLGNLFDLPKRSPWLGYRKISQKYGKLVHLQVLGRSILPINNPRIAFDLLEKRSAVNPSRPTSTIVKLMGWEWNFVWMSYGQQWRRHRRVFWQHFHPGVIPTYRAVLEEGARRLLSRLLTTPGKLEEHLRYALGVSICKEAHGLDIAEQEDARMEIFERALRSVDVLVEGATMREYFPFLAAIPMWLPGTSFLRRLAEDKKYAHSLRELPWTQVKQAVRKSPAWIPPNAGEEEGMAMSAVAMVNAADLDTAPLGSLFPALCLHPEVHRKARAELDSVVGPNRLPTFADRDALPCVIAIAKELLRWHSALPLGIARCSVAADEYEGYFIPANRTILVNSWSIVHDPENYPEPDRFLLERFLNDGKLDSDVTDPSGVAFGFGRRICTERYFADEALFIFVACVLQVFDINPPLDEDGRPIRVEPRATAGITSHLDDTRSSDLRASA